MHPTLYGNPCVVLDDGAGPAVYAASFNPSLPIGAQCRIERWTGHQWQILSKGIPPLTNADLLMLDDGNGPRLYALVTIPPAQVQWYKWNGHSWGAPPPGFATETDWPYVSCDHGNGPVVYGFGMGGFKRWDGSQWHVIGFPTDTNNFRMSAFDLGDGADLYVYGFFSGIEGVPNTRGIARWDGRQWHALGAGIEGSYIRACVFDSGHGPELYVSSIGQIRVNGQIVPLAKWNGNEWVIVPFPGVGTLDQMVVFDDGFGPALVAKGGVSVLNGQPARGFVKFDGASWHVMPGLGNPLGTSEMVVFNDDPRGPSIFMYAGGDAGDLAQFVGCAGGHACYADCDNADATPRLTANDFQCFLNRFVSRHGFYGTTRDPYADCNQDRSFNAADFQCYLAKFAAGCT